MAVGRVVGPVFLARDDDDPCFDEDPQVRRRYTGQVEQQVDGVDGLGDVERWQALARDLVTPLRPLPGQFVEQAPHVG